MHGNWLHSLLSTTQVKSRLSCVCTGHQTTTQGRSTLPNLLVRRSLTCKARRFPPQCRGHPAGTEAVSSISQHTRAFGNINHSKFLVCSSHSIFFTSGMQNTVIVKNIPFWFKWMHLFPNGRPQVKQTHFSLCTWKHCFVTDVQYNTFIFSIVLYL